MREEDSTQYTLQSLMIILHTKKMTEIAIAMDVNFWGGQGNQIDGNFYKKDYNSGSFRRSAYQGKRANKRRADEDADWPGEKTSLLNST